MNTEKIIDEQRIVIASLMLMISQQHADLAGFEANAKKMDALANEVSAKIDRLIEENTQLRCENADLKHALQDAENILAVGAREYAPEDYANIITHLDSERSRLFELVYGDLYKNPAPTPRECLNKIRK